MDSDRWQYYSKKRTLTIFRPELLFFFLKTVFSLRGYINKSNDAQYQRENQQLFQNLAPCCCAAGLWPHREAVVPPQRNSLRSPSPPRAVNEAAGWPEASHRQWWGKMLPVKHRLLNHLCHWPSLLCASSRERPRSGNQSIDPMDLNWICENMKKKSNWIKHDDTITFEGTADVILFCFG